MLVGRREGKDIFVHSCFIWGAGSKSGNAGSNSHGSIRLKLEATNPSFCINWQLNVNLVLHWGRIKHTLSPNLELKLWVTDGQIQVGFNLWS